jgi:hypothetical protein
MSMASLEQAKQLCYSMSPADLQSLQMHISTLILKRRSDQFGMGAAENEEGGNESVNYEGGNEEGGNESATLDIATLLTSYRNAVYPNIRDAFRTLVKAVISEMSSEMITYKHVKQQMLKLTTEQELTPLEKEVLTGVLIAAEDRKAVIMAKRPQEWFESELLRGHKTCPDVLDGTQSPANAYETCNTDTENTNDHGPSDADFELTLSASQSKEGEMVHLLYPPQEGETSYSKHPTVVFERCKNPLYTVGLYMTLLFPGQRLHPGMVLVAINGVSVSNNSFEEVMNSLVSESALGSWLLALGSWLLALGLHPI